MSNRDIDKIFKEKLSDGFANAGSPDWEVFSQILKKSEGFENLDFDKNIEGHLSNHKANYNANHWQLLKIRLIKEEFLRKKIFTVKATESILLFLMLFLFQSYNGRQEAKFDFDTQIVSNTIQDGDDLINDDKLVAGIAKFSTSNSNSSLHQKEDAASSLLKNSIINQDLFSYALSNNAFPALAARRIDIVFQNNVLGPNEHIADVKEAIHASNRKLSGIAQLNNMPTSLQSAEINEMPAMLIQMSVKPKVETFITPVLSSGVGIANSGYDPIYNLKSYKAYNNHFATGLCISSKKKNLEFQTGLIYSKRTHQPATAGIKEIYGDFDGDYYETSLQEISYDIIQVPLNFKYFIKEGGKTKVFVKAGVNANISLHNEYTITEKKLGKGNSSLINPIPLIPSTNLADNEKSSRIPKLREKEFVPGLLQKSNVGGVFRRGTIGENFFLTVSAEIGIELMLNAKNALVMGTEFNKYYKIDGIGPNKDKLSSLAFNLGIKHNLN